MSHIEAVPGRGWYLFLPLLLSPGWLRYRLSTLIPAFWLDHCGHVTSTDTGIPSTPSLSRVHSDPIKGRGSGALLEHRYIVYHTGALLEHRCSKHNSTVPCCCCDQRKLRRNSSDVPLPTWLSIDSSVAGLWWTLLTIFL